MIRFVLVVLHALLISGCSWFMGGSDNAPPPAKLLSIENPITPRKLWDTKVSGTAGTFLHLTPAIDRGRIYVAGHEGDVMGLDAESGSPLWKVSTGLAISSGVGLGDGLVLIGTDTGQAVALRQEDGSEVWRAQMSSEVLAVPRAAEGVVVVRTGDGKFTGLDSRTGTRLWVYSYAMPALTLRGSSAPILVQGLAIAGLDTGKLLVLSLHDGLPRWEKSIAPPRGRTEIDRIVDIDSEPQIAGDVLYITAYQGNITAIDLRSGNTLWSRDFSSHAGLDVDSERVYITDDTDAVWALDRRNGGALWKQSELHGRRLSAPVVSDDYVVVGDAEGYLHWLNKEDGRVVGRERVDRKGINVAPIVWGGNLYVLGENGVLSAFRVGPS
jgi:outer membrane protein assembly factor BamB